MESKSEHIEHLLRLMLFSKLFNDDTSKQILMDLSQQSIWQIKNMWVDITIYLVKDIIHISDYPSYKYRSLADTEKPSE
jgi:hypothetical protein